MPSRAPRWQSRDTALAGVLFAAAVGVRLAFLAGVRDHPAVRLPVLDAEAYHTKAQRILSGQGLGDAVFYQDPLYPYFLAGLYALFGPGSPAALAAQCVLDAGTVVLVFALGRELFGVRAGAVAGAVAALYEPSLFYDVLLLKVALSVFLVTLALWALVVAARGDRGAWWGAGGAALGLAALTRGNYLAFLPAALAWIALATAGGARRRAWRAGLVAAGAAVAIAPATLHNLVVGSDLVLVTSQAGQNLWLGNQRDNDTGRYRAPPFVTANPFFEERGFRAEAERRTGGARLAPSQVSHFWLREGLREIAADPAHFARHTLLKTQILAGHLEVPATASFAFYREHVAPALRLPGPTWGAVFPLALLGMALGWREPRARLLLVYFAFYREHVAPALRLPGPTWGAVFPLALLGMALGWRDPRARLLLVYFAVYAATVILTFNMGRYRMPLVPVAMVFAGAALAHGAALARARRWPVLAGAALLLVPLYVLVYRDVTHDDLSASHYNLGTRLLREAAAHGTRAEVAEASGDRETARRERSLVAEQLDAAEAQYRAGLALEPEIRPLREGLARVLLARAREARRRAHDDRALALTRRAARTAPGFAEGHLALGRALVHAGRYAEAREALRRALALDPGSVEARQELAFVQRLAASARTEAR